MNEKKLENVKSGLAVLICDILLLILAFGGVIAGGIMGEDLGIPFGWVILAVSLIILCFGWIPLIGLRVIKPQEALVLTLFGNYIGTLKDAGFYYVNPFSSAVNPAAKTKLNQSGDVGTIKLSGSGTEDRGQSSSPLYRISPVDE